MRITELHFEGPTQNFAIARRKRGSAFIEVEIITPAGTRKHSVQANDRGDIWSMADALHHGLEGRDGTRAELQTYYAPLQLLSDL